MQFDSYFLNFSKFYQRLYAEKWNLLSSMKTQIWLGTRLVSNVTSISECLTLVVENYAKADIKVV